jgi:hypothetical protein
MADPDADKKLETMIGRAAAVNTGQKIIRGRLMTVAPEHVVLREIDGRAMFIIRMQKIVWVRFD